MTDFTPNEPDPEDQQLQRWQPNVAQLQVALICLVTGLIVIAVRLANLQGMRGFGVLQGTAALYLGVPLLLALAVVLSPRAKSSYGMVAKAVTIVLLMSALFLGEGFICILMASPLFYGFAMLVTWAAKDMRQGPRMRSALLLPLVALSSEGVTPATTVGQLDAATASIVVQATPQEVEQAMARPLDFRQAELPTYLAMGFPTPLHVHGEGLAVGATRVVTFDGGSERPGPVPDHHWTAEHSTLAMSVVEHRPGHVTFAATDDSTPIASWLQWKTATVEWTDQGNGMTRIEWTLNYERQLAPSWYFSPWQQHATGLSAQYLLKSIDL